MKKLVTLLLFGAFALSCTDKAYDLSQIETGDVAIGNDDSEFRMPLMTVLVPMADLSANGEDIRSIFDEADIWLPTAATAVDLVRLDSDPDYRTQLIAATVAEMHTSDAKLNAVIGLSYEQYYASFARCSGLIPRIPTRTPMLRLSDKSSHRRSSPASLRHASARLPRTISPRSTSTR